MEGMMIRRELLDAIVAIEKLDMAELHQVNKYTHPTPDHKEYKQFMIDQLESVLEHSMVDYYNTNLYINTVISLSPMFVI